VTGTNLRLTCDHLEVVIVRLGDKTVTLSKLDKFRSLVATGHVHIVQGDREASCGHAEVLPGEDRIVLTEKPVVTYNDGANTWVQAGSRITLLRGKGEVEVDNPETTGPSVKNLGFDPTKPSAPTPKQP
jgi:lipopolysaccharide export system protein LptA